MRILLSISIILIGFCSFAGVVVLDQNGQGDYTTFTDAFSNTSTGDTIYVVGSSSSYGNISLSSSRTIIGNGYFGQSLGYHASSTVGNVTISAGAANSVFIGIVAGVVTYSDSNILFVSCHLSSSSTIGASITNVSFEKCYFTAPLTVQGNGISISNSIFNYAVNANVLTVSGGVEAALSYNTFYDGNLSLDTAIVNNCIVNTTKVTQVFPVIIEGEFGNKVDTEANLLFEAPLVNDEFFPSISSPALTSSEEGGESGAFGFPPAQPELAYTLSGLPPLPLLENLDYSAASNSSGGLDVRIQASADVNINQILINVFDGTNPIETQIFNGFTPGLFIDEMVNLNTSAYNTGMHNFTVEIVDAGLNASIPVSGSFLQEEMVVANANVTDLEYFVNSDPGAGLGNPLSITPSSSITTLENLDLTNLTEGFQTLYLRAKDETGRWGGYQSQTIYVESGVGVGDVVLVDALEYFIDVDPGAGAGTPITISSGGEVALVESLDLTGSSEGFHTIYLRAKLLSGAWGAYSSTTIYIESSIGIDDVVIVDELEYFIDTDPGVGLGSPITISQGGEVAVLENLNLSGVQTGFHTVYLRGKLLSGAWGPYSATTVYVESTIGLGDVVVIDALEYFIDVDPGAGLGTTIVASAASEISLSETIDATGLSLGFHTLYLRGKLVNGAWGPYTSQTVYVEASGQVAEQITEIEYFFDVDPGVGNGFSASASLPSASINEMISISSSGLTGGNHKVGIRAKNESGLWSHYFTQEMEVISASLVESVADGNWDDPGIWSGSAVPSQTDSVSIKNLVTLNIATDTVLSLTVASGGNLNLGGNDLHVWSRFTTLGGGVFRSSGGILYLDGGTQTYSQEGNLELDKLVFGGTGTKVIDVIAGNSISITDSLHIEPGVALSFTDSPELSLIVTADFINEGSVSTSNKWSLAIDGVVHLIEGGDFDNVTFSQAATLNIENDFNYDGSFNSGGFASTLNLGSNSLNLGNSWNFENGDNFNFSVGGRLEVNKTVNFSMVADVPLTMINISSGSFDTSSNLIFGPDQLLIIESGTVNLNSASFSGSGGINLTGGSLNVVDNNLSFGTGSFLANDGGTISITGASSSITGLSVTDDYTMLNSSGSLILDGTLITEVGGLGIVLLGGTTSISNVSFANGLGLSYITFDTGFDGSVYQNVFFEPGPTFNVSMNDEIAETVTFDNYGGTFGGPDFHNPGTTGTINWTNPQGVGEVIVVTPNGGETLIVGDLYDITWNTTNVPESDLIEIILSRDGGETSELLASGTFGTFGGVFQWSVTGEVGSQNFIVVTNISQGIFDDSDGVFNITEPVGEITILTPNGGEELIIGDSYEITWSTINVPGSDLIEILLSTDGGETFVFETDGTFDTYNGSFSWTVSDFAGTENVIQVVNTTQGVSDQSDGFFTIAQSSGGTPVANAATNITSTSFRANWSSVGADKYFLDVSVESDFTSFVSGFENVEVFATFLVVGGLDFKQSYHYRVRADDAGSTTDNSNTISATTIIDSETISDSTALVQIYNSLGGSSWSSAVNWTTARLRNWDNVDLNSTRTRVENVTISGVGAAGDMPNPFTGNAVGGLSEILLMNASSNKITGLMDFTETSIGNLNVSGNSLQFNDLEPLVGITTLDYSNQSSNKFTGATTQPVKIRYTNNYNLSTAIGGSANQYQWYRNEVAISTSADFTYNGNNLDIVSIDYDNMGSFRVEVTSTLVPNLTIDIDPQLVLAIADFEVRVLGANDQPIADNVFGALLETTRRKRGFDTLERASNVASTFTFPDVVLGNYLTAVNSDPSKYIPTYSGDEFLWTEADTIEFRNDDGIDLRIQILPGETEGDGKVSGTIDENFAEDDGRIDARRRAAKRKCGLRRKRTGGRTESDHDFELIAYGETNDRGEFEFGFLPTGTYRFFVEYPGIPLDESSFVQFEVGEAGISENEFKLAATVSETGIVVELIEELGVINKYFKDLVIYPNPSSELLNISYRHLTTDAVSVQLIDITGAVLFETDLSKGYDRDLHLDVRDYQEGIYILRFYDKKSREKNMMSYRIMVKH